MVYYECKEFKTIINKLKYIDTWFYVRYTINPYQGCEHACIYCDARSERYYLHPEFDQTIVIKNNVKEKLDRRLSRARSFLPDVTAMGGVNDAYQPAEKRFGNTRQILEILLKHRYPVSISTKSVLVLRDLDLFSKIAEITWCDLAFTITSIDEDVSSFLEPRAATSEERFSALEKIKEEYPSIQTGVNFMPIVPFLEDSDENMEAIVRNAHEVKVDYINFAGLTLRDQQATYFLQKLREKYPEIVKKFHRLYRGKYIPQDKDYILDISKKMLQFCKKYSVKYRKKRWIPTDFRRVNYLVAQDLADKAYKLQILGKRGDKEWLWAANHINNLTQSIVVLAQKDELETIQNVKGKIKEEVERLIKKYDKSKTLESYFE
ncbi:MAG: radical SAM protein [Candidatus Helarchaeota archaeon]